MMFAAGLSRSAGILPVGRKAILAMAWVGKRTGKKPVGPA